MDPWTVGLAVLVVVGLIVVVYGAVADRTRNHRAAQEMLSPPSRDIPQFRADAPAPHYLSELQARRAPETSTSTALATEDRESLKRRLDRPDVTVLRSGYASKDFVTDPPLSCAVLDEPAVLLCADPVLTLREVLSVMESLLVTNRALVVVAPDLSAEVLATLEVNAIQQTMRLCAVAGASREDLDRAAAATGGEVITRSDLQSGYLSPTSLGGCGRWVSSANRSYIVPASGSDG